MMWVDKSLDDLCFEHNDRYHAATRQRYNAHAIRYDYTVLHANNTKKLMVSGELPSEPFLCIFGFGPGRSLGTSRRASRESAPLSKPRRVATSGESQYLEEQRAAG